MPYKDPKDPREIARKKAYYQRTKEGRYERIKHNIFNWRERNPEKYKESVKKYFDKNKEKVLEQSRSSYKKHIAKRHISQKKSIDDLSDSYVINQLSKAGFLYEVIKDNRELIETKRILIKTKRLLKQAKNEKH